MPTEDHSSDRSRQGVPQGGGVELSLDELAKGLATGTLSRGKALRLMGAALVGGALASTPGIAWAKPKPAGRKCKHNHQCESGQCVDGECGGGGCTGTPLTEGDCNCAFVCNTDPDLFICQDNPNCNCLQTVEGTGFCSEGGFCDRPCSSTAECPATWMCVLNTCCDAPVCLPPCPATTSSA